MQNASASFATLKLRRGRCTSQARWPSGLQGPTQACARSQLASTARCWSRSPPGPISRTPHASISSAA
eukprot:7472889-Pyramimonas_sp.AAC.1